MPFPLSRWKLSNHCFNNPAFFGLRSLYWQAVDLELSKARHVHMQGNVAHNMHLILAVYQRIFSQLIQIFH